MTRSARHVLTSWIACLAMLFGALAPGISHAFLRAAPQVADFPICSATGHGASQPGSPGIDLGVDPFKHCPFCADQQHTPGLPPAGVASLVAVGGAVLPALFYQSPAPLFHWAAPLSRAPPAVS